MLLNRLLLLACLCSACVPTFEFYWPGPGTRTAQEHNRDGYECERDVRMAAAGFRPASSRATPLAEFQADMQMRGMFRDCMEARGWRVKD